ncbi:hypothetical protein WJX84_004934 [Apatococcus fuscideae]|uniref:UspA domain-containing protein n=1 Tax=Apatococcus fuscideae TaxID=2026836 RepID=A0AAW1T2Q7_9CHLO
MASESNRNILLPVDDSEGCERACKWAVEHLYRGENDEFHILHIIPSQEPEVISGLGGISGMDAIVTAKPDPAADKQHVEEANNFIQHRMLPYLTEKGVRFKVELCRYLTDNDSIGDVVCKRAEALNAVAVVLQSHNKSAITEFFMGSVANYTANHCRQPILLMH